MLRDPLACPRPGSRPFEVRIYNKEVRALVKQNRHHRDFADHWADDNRQAVEAVDAAEARALANRRYPPERGFVVSAVTAIDPRRSARLD